MTTGMPPGWYPDPDKPRRRFRYWDGYSWTSHTQPPPPSTAPANPRRRWRIAWAAVAAAVLVAGGFGVAVFRNHQEIQSISSDGTVTFYRTGGGQVDVATIEARQADLEQQLAQLEQQAQAAPDVDTGVELSGVWRGNSGYGYQIQQYGTGIVIQEMCSCGYVTAVGQGSFDGATLLVSYQAFDGSVGAGQLELTGPDQLTGNFRNQTYGTITPTVVLQR